MRPGGGASGEFDQSEGDEGADGDGEDVFSGARHLRYKEYRHDGGLHNPGKRSSHRYHRT